MGKKWYLHQEGTSVFVYSEDTPVKNPKHPDKPLGKIIDITLPKNSQSAFDAVTVSNNYLIL